MSTSKEPEEWERLAWHLWDALAAVARRDPRRAATLAADLVERIDEELPRTALVKDKEGVTR